MPPNVIQTQFEDNKFTMLIVSDSATDGGSLVERDRVFPLAFDIPRNIANELQLEENYHRVLKAMRLKQYPFEFFHMDDEVPSAGLNGQRFGSKFHFVLNFCEN
jgi:hypothetical protein